MAGINFATLFEQADRFRDSAQTTEAVKAYQDIANLATEAHELSIKAKALHLAGVSIAQAITGEPNSYYRDALNFYRQAEELLVGQQDQLGLGSLYRDIARAADAAGQTTAALDFFQKAIERLTTMAAYGELAITYDKLGEHYYRLGQYDAASQFTGRALELFKKEPTSGFFRATTLYDSARVNFKKGEVDTALDLALESLGWFEADHPGKDYTQRLAELACLLAAIYTQLGNKRQADSFFTRYRSLLKTFDPLAIKSIEKELQTLVSENGSR